ncbi:MAG TPA: phage baseplate assembly protein V [Candidatus Sulfopaludibacter sp.]|jgi:hypothetical protein|nr:phage baseplate assembly protein V [Candidatus Sulfopaludibacter sp.]
MSEVKKFYGKFRGTVINVVDPEQRGRIQVMVPDVSGFALSSWALPAFPIGGIQQGLFSMPIPGSGVWVEFEQGDLDYPIWTGVFYGSAAEVPVMAHLIPPEVPGIVLQTVLQNGLLISDLPGPTGGIMLKTTAGAMILINEIGITISNGQGAMIQMTGPSVIINGGALTII